MGFDFQATMFRHPREAQGLAQDQMMFHFARGGFKMALRFGAFSTMYAAGVNSLGTAFNRVSPLDHMLTGFTVGFLWRALSGPKPALATGILGSLMGLVAGVPVWIIHVSLGKNHY